MSTLPNFDAAGVIMMQTTFDTLRYSKRLQELGFTREQSEGFAELQRELIDERLATKADIARLEQTTKTEIARLELATKAEIAQLDAKLSAKIEGTAVELKHEMAALRHDIVIQLGKIVVGSATVLAVVLGVLMFAAKG